MLEDLTGWARRSPRRTAALGCGAAVAIALLLLVMNGGGAVAPVTGVTPSTEVAGNAPAAIGQAQDPAAQPSARPPGDGADEAAAAGAAGAPVVSRAQQASTRALEAMMNREAAPSPPADVPVTRQATTPPAVQEVGRVLEDAYRRVSTCMRDGDGDVLECLGHAKDAAKIVRIYNDDPQGAALSRPLPGGGALLLSFRGDTVCRSTSARPSDCNAWSE